MLQPPWSASHCSSRMWPVAAASCAGEAPFKARASAASPSSPTRNCRHSRRPHLAAWCTGPAPWASVMAGARWPEDASSLRVTRSPARAAWMARWSTIPRLLWVGYGTQTELPGVLWIPAGYHLFLSHALIQRTHCLVQSQEKWHPSGSQLASTAVGERRRRRRGGQSQRDRKVMKDGWRRTTRGLLLSFVWHWPYAGTRTNASLEMGELRQHGNLSNGRSQSQGMVNYNECYFLQLF